MKVELRMAKLFQCTQLNGTSETPISNLTLLSLRPQEAIALSSDSHRWLSQDLGLTRLPKILSLDFTYWNSCGDLILFPSNEETP